MSDDSRLDSLLDEWEVAREQGREISLDELCRDCPELRDELERRIRKLAWADNILDTRTSRPISDGPVTDVPKVLGRYRLIQQIGQGGFGHVWRAYDPQLERYVAVKVLSPERSRNGAQMDRFLAEARKIARMRHPNIVAVHDVGRDAGLCYIVSDLIGGGDLAQRLASQRMSPKEAVEIVAKVADGLQHAHDLGVIHRDIKPKNILLGKNREPYITDFGIAITESELLDGEFDTAGSPAYMAPEQASLTGPPVDARTDVYGLGVVLYEMLVGLVPYEDTTLAMIRTRFKRWNVASPSVINPAVSQELSIACLKAIAHDPNARWGSARHFADGLRQIPAMPLPETAKPTPTSTPSNSPSAKPHKRSLGELLAVGGIILAILIFVVMGNVLGIFSFLDKVGATIGGVTQEEAPWLFAAGKIIFPFAALSFLVWHTLSWFFGWEN